MIKTRWTTAILAALLAALLPTAVWTQTFPSKPVKILIGSAPGGILDVAARSIGQKLSERWGVSVIVEGRLGAAVAMPDVAQRITDAGLTVSPASTEQFGAVIRSEYDHFAQLVKLSSARRMD